MTQSLSFVCKPEPSVDLHSLVIDIFHKLNLPALLLLVILINTEKIDPDGETSVQRSDRHDGIIKVFVYPNLQTVSEHHTLLLASSPDVGQSYILWPSTKTSVKNAAGRY